MCLACEQDAMWLAYLESQGLLKPDDPQAVEALFSAFPVQPLPVQAEWDAPTPEAPASVEAVAEKPAAEKPATENPAAKTLADKTLAAKNPFSCDDPTAG
jgi:hypothetical protein